MTRETAIQQSNGHDKRAALERSAPLMDIFENDEEYLVRADLPGVAEEDVDIQFEKGELRLYAPRPLELQGDRLSQEIGAQAFERAFRIPQKIDLDAISATLEHGVLELRLPKAPEVRPRKITVKAAS